MSDKRTLRLAKYNSQLSGQTALCAYIHENERCAHIVHLTLLKSFRKLSDSNTLGYLLKLYKVEK